MQAVSQIEPTTYVGPTQVLDLARSLEGLRTGAVDYVVDGADLFCLVVEPDEISLEFGKPAPRPNVCLAWQIAGEKQTLPLTRWAQTQLSDDCGIPIRYWDRMTAAGKHGLLAENVNQWLPDLTGRRLRTHPGLVRAVVSSRFRALDNYDLLLSAIKAVRGSTAEVQKADVTESRLYLRMIDPVHTIRLGDGTDFHPGVVVRNSEVGDGALMIAPYVWRQVCSNGAILKHALREIHVGTKVETGLLSHETIALEGELAYRAAEDVITTIFRDQSRFEEYVQSMDESLGVRIADPPKVVESMTLRRQVTKTEAELILATLVSDPTISPEYRGTEFALRQAVSAVARDTTNPDRAAELEMLAAQVTVEELV